MQLAAASRVLLQETGTSVVEPTGAIFLIMLLSAALALPASFALLRVYRRTVIRSMRAGSGRSEPPPRTVAAAAPADALRLRVIDERVAWPPTAGAASWHAFARTAPWRAAAVYAVAGLAYAIVLGCAMLYADGMELLPVRVLMVSWTFVWPAVLAVNMVAATDRRSKLLVLAAYFAIFAAVGAAGLRTSPDLTIGQVAGYWLLVNLLPTLLLQAFLNRRVRAIGPLMFTWILLAATGAVLGPGLAAGSDARARLWADIAVRVGIGGEQVFLGLILLGFALCAAGGLLIVVWIRRRYERKQVSDQSLVLDSTWVLFTIVYVMTLLMPEGGAWALMGIAALVVYKTCTAVGFAILRRANRSRPGAPPRLLLLRVFALGRHSEKLFDAVTTHWRYMGAVQLIAGPDLATTAIEPHELLDFVGGKLSRRFIDGPATLQQRLDESDEQPDRDLRFRVNEFFCRADAWRPTLSRLVGQSEAVLMDLRGFSRQHAGCVYELGVLVDVVPLERVVLLIDRTTDRAFLEETLRDAWAAVGADSPNRRAAEPEVRMYALGGRRPRRVQRLLLLLCHAVAEGRPAVARAPA